MTQKIIYTDGVKSVPIWDDGDFWDMIIPQNNSTDRNIMSRVAAASRARNLTASAVANVPFAIVNKSGEEVDSSQDWQNIVKFMPKPRDLIRRLSLSLMDNNGAYLRMGKNALNVPKQLHYVKYDSIRPVVKQDTGELLYLSRIVNGKEETRYAPDDKSLIRFWILDDTTELLPSDETETRSVLSASGILFYSDTFTENYYRRGGVKPTLIAMKGMVTKEKREDLQKDWTTFVRGIGRGVQNIAAKIFQAEAMDIKAFGDGLGDLKETPVYRQALENIAIGRGMPLSILLSNSANRATADTEILLWFRNDIIPRFDFIADVLNDDVFKPMGYQIQNRAETADPEQEDEVSRVGALSGYGDALAKYPDAETFLTAAQGVFGYELPDNHVEAIMAYYAAKKQNAEAITANMEKKPGDKPQDTPVEDNAVVEDDPQEEEKPVPAKWIPSIDELDELRIWREVALRRFKKGDSLDFEYQPHRGGLPDSINWMVKGRLAIAASEEEVKSSFNIDETYIRPAQVLKSEPSADILKLAESINRLAESQMSRKVEDGR